MITDIPLGAPDIDRPYFERLIAEKECLDRRKTHALREQDFEMWAFMVANNSHRFRRRGLDKKIWRFT